MLRVSQGPVLEVSQDLGLRVSLVLCRVSLYGGSRVLITHQNLCVNMTICILYNFLPRRCGGGGGGLSLVTLRVILEGRGGRLHFPLGPG